MSENLHMVGSNGIYPYSVYRRQVEHLPNVSHGLVPPLINQYYVVLVRMSIDPGITWFQCRGPLFPPGPSLPSMVRFLRLT